jgi:hypothetical protein
MLDVPKALISLVDETRQWFKSFQGSAMTETSRKIFINVAYLVTAFGDGSGHGYRAAHAGLDEAHPTAA